jgi:hypothetical protein
MADLVQDEPGETVIVGGGDEFASERGGFDGDVQWTGGVAERSGG